jgi:hypothetical protein
MARAYYVKSARKDNPAVKKGQPYWWWKFRYGGKRYSATRPRPSQLTSSPYYSAIRQMIEFVEDSEFPVGDTDQLETVRDDLTTQLQELLDETQDALDNMPEQLQDGSVLQERVEALESAISEVEDVEAPDDWEDEDVDDEDKEEFDTGLFIEPISAAEV